MEIPRLPQGLGAAANPAPAEPPPRTHPVMARGSQDPRGIQRFVQDVLLHETIHQYQLEILQVPEPSYDGHGPLFRDTASTIGRISCHRARVEGPGTRPTLPSCAQWPHNVRPADYYCGAIQAGREATPCPEDVLFTCPRAGSHAPWTSPRWSVSVSDFSLGRNRETSLSESGEETHEKGDACKGDTAPSAMDVLRRPGAYVHLVDAWKKGQGTHGNSTSYTYRSYAQERKGAVWTTRTASAGHSGPGV